MYLIANLAVGGNGPSEPLDWSALDPPGTNLSIDYVRVYALEDGFDGYEMSGPALPSTLPPVLLPTAGVALVVGAAAAAVLWRRHQRRRMPAGNNRQNHEVSKAWLADAHIDEPLFS